MCVTEDMQTLAADFYRAAKDYRPTQPDVADRMMAEADDIIRQFGPLDCPQEHSEETESPSACAPQAVPPEDDPQMAEILRMMAEARVKSEEYQQPRRSLIGSLFRG